MTAFTPPNLPCKYCLALAGEMCKPTEEFPDWSPAVLHKVRLDDLADADRARREYAMLAAQAAGETVWPPL